MQSGVWRQFGLIFCFVVFGACNIQEKPVGGDAGTADDAQQTNGGASADSGGPHYCGEDVEDGTQGGCPEEMICYRGVCYEAGCEDASDCADGDRCHLGGCVPESCESIECEPHKQCYRGVCYESCDGQADCDAEDRCHDEACVPTRCEDINCESHQQCYQGVCYGGCSDDGDCADNEECLQGACLAPSCDDGLQSGAQTDVDCGGPDCPPCPPGAGCESEQDCEVGTCQQGACTGGCEVPWGGVAVEGETITAYQSQTVACEQECSHELRTCAEGELSGSYQYESCQRMCDSCSSETLNWGGHDCEGLISSTDHGESRTASNERSGRSGEATYECYDGSWTYADGTCEAESCALPWGGTIDHDQSVTAYNTDSAGCDESCADQQRHCNYGELTGSYDYESCQMICADCGATTVTWEDGDTGLSCEGDAPTGVHSESVVVEGNIEIGFYGESTFTCEDGTWVESGTGSCEHW